MYSIQEKNLHPGEGTHIRIVWIEYCIIEKMKAVNTIDKMAHKVLIVDDEGDVCYLLSKLLKQKDMEFEQVNTLAQAETILKEDHLDIIFLDHNLPDGLGINFIDKVKKDYPGIKIVLITAHDTVMNKNRAMKKGADQFIAKPFTSEQIYNCVDQLVNL
jgi:two-component system, OmpR family, response regulator